MQFTLPTEDYHFTGIFSVPFEAHANKHWNVVQHKDSIGHVPLVGPRGAVCFSKSGGEGAGSLFL